MKITGFTSLLEASYGKLPVASSSLLNGIRIRHEDTWYLVGQACRNLSRNPHRLVNATPEEVDYQVLFLSALLLSTQNSSERIELTVGFPYSTYNIYRSIAEKFLLKKNFVIEYDTATYKKDGIIEKKLIEIGNFELIPELAACVIGLKKHYRIPEENFLIISLGFGTIEIGVVSAEGLNKRTVISIPGIVRCIKNLRDELEKEHIVGFMTDHQLDDAFVKGSVILNRNLINLKNIRSNILKSFYKEYISDTLKSMISDRDFERIEKIYVCGGGVHYEELQQLFRNEFDKFTQLEFVKESDVLAATGYYYNSVRISNGPSSIPVGIDLGNSSTYVCTNDL
jgi:hypothetical protein